jgi:hypothetical protein
MRLKIAQISIIMGAESRLYIVKEKKGVMGWNPPLPFLK